MTIKKIMTKNKQNIKTIRIGGKVMRWASSYYRVTEMAAGAGGGRGGGGRRRCRACRLMRWQ